MNNIVCHIVCTSCDVLANLELLNYIIMIYELDHADCDRCCVTAIGLQYIHSCAMLGLIHSIHFTVS